MRIYHRCVMFVALLFVCFLSGCARPPQDRLRILVPEGSTALSHSLMEYEHAADYDIARVTGADLLVAAFASASYDAIVAPVTLGMKMRTQGAPYKLAAVITWGNLFIASASSLTTLADLDGHTITAFGERQVPDFVLSTLLDEETFEQPPNITYVGSARETMLEMVRRENITIMTAEPFLSFDIIQRASLHVLDLGALWREKHHGETFPQAAIFVKEDLDGERVETYLSHVAAGIQWLIEGDGVVEVIEYLDYPLDAETLLVAIPGSGFEFQNAALAFAALSRFFAAVYAFDSAIIGHVIPGEDTYFWGDD